MSEAIRILCAVQDRQSLRRLMMEMDDGKTCIFDIVTSGQRAAEICAKTTPDILVLDDVLPGMDGMGVLDWLKAHMGERMPRVIGGARTSFSHEGFMRRGVKRVIGIPWDATVLGIAIRQEIADMQSQIDWRMLHAAQACAGDLLAQMGMSTALKGYEYLCCAAALAYESESRLYAVGKEIYAPIAARFHTTNANVERLIRHAMESTMSAARARGVYTLFGNTSDPAKGKPTNAQVIALLAQRIKIEKSKAM